MGAAILFHDGAASKNARFVQVVVLDASDKAILNVDNLVGFVGHTTLVGHHNNGLMLVAVELLQHYQHHQPGLRLEGARRLVGKDDLGVGNEGARDGHTLLLSTRHLIGIV